MANAKRSTGKNSQESRDEQVNDATYRIMDLFHGMRDLGENLHRLPLTGWTVGASLKSLVCAARTCIAADFPASKDVRVIRLFKDAHALLDAIDGASEALENADYDDGMRKHPETRAIGVGIEKLAQETSGAIERASYLLAPSTFAAFSMTADEIEQEFALAKAA